MTRELPMTRADFVGLVQQIFEAEGGNRLTDEEVNKGLDGYLLKLAAKYGKSPEEIWTEHTSEITATEVIAFIGDMLMDEIRETYPDQMIEPKMLSMLLGSLAAVATAAVVTIREKAGADPPLPIDEQMFVLDHLTSALLDLTKTMHQLVRNMPEPVKIDGPSLWWSIVSIRTCCTGLLNGDWNIGGREHTRARVARTLQAQLLMMGVDPVAPEQR
jgi:hypothetical protein